MKFYLKLEGEVIHDAITYPYDGYTEVELQETHLPAGINAGYYLWKVDHYEIDSVRKTEADKIASGDIGELMIKNEVLSQQLAQTNADAVAFQEFIFANFPELA